MKANLLSSPIDLALAAERGSYAGGFTPRMAGGPTLAGLGSHLSGMDRSGLPAGYAASRSRRDRCSSGSQVQGPSGRVLEWRVRASALRRATFDAVASVCRAA